jgi:hypothetical protein
MYEGLTRLLIVYLTHPGIVLSISPSPPALLGRVSFVAVLWAWLRGLWQASWVMVMHSFSEGKRATLASWVYWGVLFMSMWLSVIAELPPKA